MIYTQEAIIVNFRDFSEADKIITLLSKGKGRINAIAKGVRKPKSRKSASIDLANRASFSLARGRTFDIITEVKLLNSYQNNKKSMLKIASVSFILQLINKFYSDPGLGEDLYEDLRSVLETLDLISNDIAQISNLVIGFEVKLLDKSGFLRVPEKRSTHTLQQQRLYKIIQFLKNTDFDQVKKLTTTTKDIDMLDNYVYNQILNILEKELKSYQLLKKVLHDEHIAQQKE